GAEGGQHGAEEHGHAEDARDEKASVVAADDRGEAAADDEEPDKRAYHRGDQPRALPHHPQELSLEHRVDRPNRHQATRFPAATQRKTSFRFGRRTRQAEAFPPTSAWSRDRRARSSSVQRKCATSPSRSAVPSFGSRAATRPSRSAPSTSRMWRPSRATSSRGAPDSTSRPLRVNTTRSQPSASSR